MCTICMWSTHGVVYLASNVDVWFRSAKDLNSLKEKKGKKDKTRTKKREDTKIISILIIVLYLKSTNPFLSGWKGVSLDDTWNKSWINILYSVLCTESITCKWNILYGVLSIYEVDNNIIILKGLTGNSSYSEIIGVMMKCGCVFSHKPQSNWVFNFQ